MMRKILKTIGWFAGGVFGLGVVLYLIAVAINWRDREPSAIAVRFANTYRERPAVADQDNAFIYVMGFAVAPGENPGEMGTRRVAWMQESNRAGRFDAAQDPLRERVDYKAKRPPAVREFVEACKPRGAGCAAAFAAGDEVFEQWAASESWLLERYLTLIGYSGWQETVTFDVTAPVPSYALVMDGQRLLLLKAKVMAERGDSIGVKKLLEEDLRFWRMVLESSDTLISKMIATAAINRHFEIGSLVFRKIQSGNVLNAVPANWRVPISDSERSMRRCLVGEWMYRSAVLRNSDTDPYSLNDESVVTRVMRRLTAAFYQRQDSTNRSAEYLARMTELLSVPIDRFGEAVSRAKEFSERTRRETLPPRSPYNMVGQVLQGLAASDVGSYAGRVADLEGVRRAAFTSVSLRAQNVAPSQMVAALTAAPLRNPYNNRPFEWDDKADALVFWGLEHSARAEHRIFY
jgi:hypothetical protein